MQAIETWITRLNRALVAVVLALVFLIVFINVVGRYGFGSSFAWAAEVSRHLMILGAFCGAGLALREGRLVAIDAIFAVLPDRLVLPLRWIIVGVMFAFMALMLWLGVRFLAALDSPNETDAGAELDARATHCGGERRTAYAQTASHAM